MDRLPDGLITPEMVDALVHRWEKIGTMITGTLEIQGEPPAAPKGPLQVVIGDVPLGVHLRAIVAALRAEAEILGANRKPHVGCLRDADAIERVAQHLLLE